MVIGNQQENMKDMDRKGRRATKLTPEEVSMIQAAPVGCQNELAETFLKLFDALQLLLVEASDFLLRKFQHACFAQPVSFGR